MSRLGAVISFVLFATSANAQTDRQAMILSGLSDCITDAIATSSVQVNGDIVIFSCSAAKAKILYNFVGNKIQAEVVLDRNGKFENRQFGNNACYHRVEDPEWQSRRRISLRFDLDDRRQVERVEDGRITMGLC